MKLSYNPRQNILRLLMTKRGLVYSLLISKPDMRNSVVQLNLSANTTIV